MKILQKVSTTVMRLDEIFRLLIDGCTEVHDSIHVSMEVSVLCCSEYSQYIFR